MWTGNPEAWTESAYSQACTGSRAGTGALRRSGILREQELTPRIDQKIINLPTQGKTKETYVSWPKSKEKKKRFLRISNHKHALTMFGI